ncbi:hypothetical protein F2P56_025884 [Juglans regia]|uniref:Reverse transcriptase Ty1/copia-type domain-containing protein n=1 Tax=Juglans regia TaxID=51240 RepID=A0A833TWF1_JUGRE|nr:hypothetical protein F2P56_025884 [Juglans regia]
MDDILIASNDIAVVNTFKTFTDHRFKVKDLESLKYFFGLEVARNSSSIYQRKYVLEILSDAGFIGYKPVKTLMEQHLKLSWVDDPLLEDPKSDRRLVGRLIYLTITWPDFTFAIHTLSQFMDSP